MCEYFNLIAVRHLWLTKTFNHMLKSGCVPVELGKSPSLTIVISTGRNHIDRLIVKLSSSVTFRCQDVVLLGGKMELFHVTLDGMTRIPQMNTITRLNAIEM
jgi:hypothetical protein